MGEYRRPAHIADGIHAVGSRLETVVGFDELPFIRLDARLVEPDSIGVGLLTRNEQHVRGRYRFGIIGPVGLDRDIVASSIGCSTNGPMSVRTRQI